LVVPFQSLGPHEVFEGHLQRRIGRTQLGVAGRGVVFYWQGKIQESVGITRVEPALLTVDVAFQLATVEVLDVCALLSGNSIALFNCVKEHPTELLGVMLFKTLGIFPPEAFG
jgi:hypothetical protein